MRYVKRLARTKQQRKKRSRARIRGTAARPRVSVFRSNRYTYAQLINDEIGATIVAVSTRARSKEGGVRILKRAAAETLGELLAEKAKEAGVTQAVFHRGGYKYHGRVRAVAEGLRKGGIAV